MNAVEKMETFGMLVYVSIGVAAIGLILAILFFFMFNIPDVYALRTGKAKRAAIERMSERNHNTGRLMSNVSGLTGDMSGGLTSGSLSGSMTESVAQSSSQDTSLLNASGSETSVLGNSNAETSVLGAANAETSVLSKADGDTSLLGRDNSANGMGAPTPLPATIRFEIVENTIIVNTNELI